ncbi:SusC/RagA family TonB-linked outer membrane protein [Puteibacter caeruleilacunae]|nr:SusC/RagA family TonB-linked outer membrane protein [Puteibacter caeruleilacunae]
MKKKSMLFIDRDCYPLSRCLRIMKITSLLILICLMQVSASVYSQKTALSLRLSNTSIKEVLQQIEKQSDFTFLYNDAKIDVNRKVSVNASNENVEQILEKVLAESGITFMVIDNQIILKESVSDAVAQQNVKISGTVVDEQGETMPGVSVVVKGTTIGTTTDLDGKYTLNVPAKDAVLLFSFVGMKTQEVIVDGQSNVNVTMVVDALGLEEVVVVAYGVQKKVNVTGSVSQVGAEVMESRPITKVGEGLKGVIPGLNITKASGAPNASTSWNIRGFTGLQLNDRGEYVTSNRGPLILVDGIEMNPDFLNPEDIENISVLKDAAASAIYGSRAPYGVVLITTKTGKEGKLKVNYNSNYNWSSMKGVPEVANGYDFATTFDLAMQNARAGSVFGPETIEKIKAYMEGNGPNNTIQDDGLWGQWGQAHGNTDWMKEFFKDHSFNHNQNLSVSGAAPGGKLDYYVSFGYAQNKGLLKEAVKDQYKRYNFSTKVTSRINDWLETSINIKYSEEKVARPNVSDYTILNSVARLWSTTPATNPDGVWHQNNGNWRVKYDGGYKDLNDNLSGKFEVKLTPIKGLSIVSNYAYKKFVSSFTRDRFNYEIPLPGGSTVLGGNTPNSVSASMDRDFYVQWEAIATYNFNIGDHSATILAGHQNEKQKYKHLWASKKGLITQDVPSISTATGVVDAGDRIDDWASEGYFYRLNYNYKEKYLLEVNGRYDASSKFPSDTRWSFFPSFSAGWNVAKENFWFTDKISSFKLRGSYGKLGNSNVPPYMFLSSMKYIPKIGIMVGGENASAIDMPGIINPGITWEKPEVINIGLDISAFDNRLDISYEWYQRTIKDQLAPPKTVAKTLGTTPPKLNNGTSETRGWEFTANWKDQLGDINGKPVEYTVNFNLADYRGYIVDFPNETGSMNKTWTKGEEFGDIWGYETVGIAQNVADYNNAGSHHRIWSQYWYPGDVIYKDQDGDGKIDGGNNYWNNKGDLVKLGNSTPRFQFGLNLSANWNNFDVNMFFEGVGKQDVTMGGMYFWGTTSSSWHSSVFKHTMDYWTPENTGAYFPRPYMNTGEANKNTKTQSRYVMNGAYCRLQRVSLGYKLPKRWLNGTFISSCRLYSSVENVGTIYNAADIDLDPTILRSGNGQIYPTQRVISVGANINF